VLQELNGVKEPILAVAGPADEPADVRSAERSGSCEVTSREVHCTGGNQSDGDKVGNARTGSLYRNLKQQGIFPRRTVYLVLFVS
jgi:predicted phosphodiesterase